MIRERLMEIIAQKCACKCDADTGEIVALCLEHKTMIAKAVQAEREACAAIAESWYGQADVVAADIASRIRARAQRKEEA
jgi:hypothetical protein